MNRLICVAGRDDKRELGGSIVLCVCERGGGEEGGGNSAGGA